MSHLILRSYKTRDGKQTTYDKHGRVMFKHESIRDTNRAGDLVSKTSEARPKRKPYQSIQGTPEEAVKRTYKRRK